MSPIPRDALFLGKVLSNYVIMMATVGFAMLVFGIANIVSSMSVGTAGGDQASALFGSFALGISGFFAIAAQIALIAFVTAVASRRTVDRTLAEVE